jgi:hypothetical protein
VSKFILKYFSEIDSWVGLSLTRKDLTELERIANEKHSSLLDQFVNYKCKEFYNIGQRYEMDLSDGGNDMTITKF